ncbi:MAG TPA: Ig-like domain-containing protein [Baekduia sp.]
MRLALVLCAAALAVFAPAALAAPPAPVVNAPTEGAATKSPIAFSGTAEAGGTITIAERAVEMGTAPVAADGTWAASIAADSGAHTFTITVTDAGEVSPATTRAVNVDAGVPAAPSIDSPVEGSAQRSTTVTLKGRAETDSTVTVAGQSTTAAGGEWTLVLDDQSEGAHAYTATATDAVGNVSEASAPRTVVVDLTAPAPPDITGGPHAFGLSAEAGAALECRLDGPGGAGTFAACASGIGYPDLAPGDYRFLAQATDAAGNVSAPAEHPFTVAAIVPAPSPTATPTPRATPSPVATPSFRQSVVLRPATGRTLIRRPGTTAFGELRGKTTVPLGTAVNVKDGTVVLTSAPAAGAKTETAKLLGGVFTVTQPATGIELALSETLRCGHSRQLTADGAGAFRIRGRFGTATGRGAKWQVQDSCSKTTVRVTRGVVAVLAKRAKKTVLVRAGRHYTAQSNR